MSAPAGNRETWSDWALTAADLAWLLRSARRSREGLEREQAARLLAQVEHAYRTVPFYRGRWPSGPVRAVESSGLSVLPLVRRADVQAAPHAFRSSVGDRSTWRSSQTSGSSGRPLESAFDRATWRRAKRALKLRRLLACGWRPGQRVAILDARPAQAIDAEGGPSLQRRSRLRPVCVFSLFDAPEVVLPALRAYAPDYVYAPPSYLADLARIWCADGAPCLPLAALMTSGEWAHPALLDRIRETFRAPILDVYGSTEFKEIAWQCRDGGPYHTNMESVYVEILEPGGLPAKPGEVGEVVVTSLTNRAMPLIRYATGDRGVAEPGRCACGRSSTLLGHFEGRAVDVLVFPDGRRVSPYVLTTQMEECCDALHYRIVQVERDRLDVAVVLRSGGADVERDIRLALKDVVGAGIRVDVRFVARIELGPAGKRSPVTAFREGRA